MQSVSTSFVNDAHAQVRPLAWQLRASFDKTFDDNIDFFTLDTSILDGTDVLAPSDSDVISQWDKFTYADYTDRVISMEVTREVVEPFSIVQSFADVVLNNYDNYFTPNSGSVIDQFILPKRPFRIAMGFGGESVQLFVGLSEKVPTINKMSRTASFHLIDFLSFIFEKEIGQSAMILDYSTAEILDVLFQSVGLLSTQYNLDNSFNRIPFFFVNKGDKLGPIVQELMKAEQGRLYLDELGVIRLRNRQNYSTESVFMFDQSNTIDYDVSTEDDIINSVKLTCDILAVQAEQSIWQLAQAAYIPAGDTVEVFANLNDPATSITTPTYSATFVESSHYTTTQDIGGVLPYASITLNSLTSFGTAAKLEFENTGASNAYVYAIDLWGTPVKTEDTILVEDSDQTSIDAFEERVYELETKYIQDRDSALSKAAIMVDDYKDYGSLVDIDVKGNPALQIDDVLNLDLDGYQGNHVITKLVNGMSGSKYYQRIRAKARTLRLYFILDQSRLDDINELAP